MDVPTSKKSSKRPYEPVDDWLQSQGFFRKHAPRDSTCLFRAFAEETYLTQHYHIRVRRECVDYMRKNSERFQQMIGIPLDNYLDQMSCFTERGGPIEIEAMSLLYEREVVIYDGEKSVVKPATNNGFPDTIHLCLTGQKQYENVYTRDVMATAAFCQSIVYQTFYEDVFEMANIDETVQTMLHDRTANFRHNNFFLKKNLNKRDELTTELMRNIDKEWDENVDEEKNPVRKVMTPFPYRVAKALDPNIYRNIDLDIWYEIKREVRNAGWTRWNGTELQIGGRCLVQLDHKEAANLLDKSNNNGIEQTGAKGKENEAKKPAYLFGHIQEMSKDQGPVVVFIEGIGEKRTLPFAALKPYPRRGKQNNSSPNNCRRNSTYENHKWKRTWNSNSRKSKDANGNYGMKNYIDRNNNRNENKTEIKSEEMEKVESFNDKKSSSLEENFNTMEMYNSCQDLIVKSTIDVRPVTVTLDNAQPLGQAPPPLRPKKKEEFAKNTSQATKNPPANDYVVPEVRTPSIAPSGAEMIIRPIQQISLNNPNEQFYPPPLAMQPMFPVNPNIPCTPLKAGFPPQYPCPVPFPCVTDEPPAPGSLLDRTLRAVNFSAPTSVEPNASDLPFFDTQTLRFFYNLGLEYFRSGQSLGLVPNNPANFPHGKIPGPSPPMNVNNNREKTCEEENLQPPNGGARPNYPPRRREPPNIPRNINNNQQNINNAGNKNFANRKNDNPDYSYTRRNNTNETINESSRRPQTFPAGNDRLKDYQNNRKNGQPPRFKNRPDGRSRNAFPPDTHHQPEQAMCYQNPGVNESANQSGKNETTAPIPSPTMTGNEQQNCQNATFTAPPPIFPTMQYYMENGDTFYAHVPGFYQMPYVSQPEVVSGNPVNTFSPHVYPGPGSVPENYQQSMSPVYPPYVYPPQPIYPNFPSENPQENWYPMPGQYLPYPPIPPQQNSPNGNNVAPGNQPSPS